MIKIYITQFDHDRLMKLLNQRAPHDKFDKALLSELERGEIVEPKDIPPDVVTMNSHVKLKGANGEKWDFWLVFPENVNLSEGKISVLSPTGCALLGYKVGQKVTIHTPHKGDHVLEITEVVSQPEREGKFDL